MLSVSAVGASASHTSATERGLQRGETPQQRRREMSARLLEGQLLRVARAARIVERRIGRGLLLICANRSYRRLGYVRLADYLTERLGMSLRRCQSLLRIERALDRLPRLAAAFDAGSLSASKLSIIAAVATPETQEFWLARGERATVRELEEMVAASRAPEPASTKPAPGAADEGMLVSFSAPGRTVALWHWALDLIRRVAGRQEPAWRCAEYLAAEFLSGAPRSTPQTKPNEPAGSSSASPKGNNERVTSNRHRLAGGEVWSQAVAAVREALGCPGRDRDLESIFSGRLPDAPEHDLDPWALDARLRSLVHLRQSLSWRQGRLLAPVSAFSLNRELGFISLGDWCREAIGMSPRRARYLVSLDRRLARLPLLGDAYRRGRISWCQARQLVRIAGPATQRPWIRYARKVTVRRLEEAVTSALVSMALDAPAGVPAGPSSDPSPPEEPSPREPFPLEPSSGRHMLAPPYGSRSRAGLMSGETPSLPFPGDAPRHPSSLPRHRIAFWAPNDLVDLWGSALDACRQVAGRDLRDWECLEMLIQALRDTWEDPGDPGWRRRYRIFERDRWRCRAPGCSSRSNLNEHHIVFRSQGGGDEDDNLVTLCIGHHQNGIHQGRLRCAGRASGPLWWELGSRTGAPPLVRYFGERMIGAG